MTTLDLIQAKLLHLDESDLQQIHRLIEQLSQSAKITNLTPIVQTQGSPSSQQSALDAAGDIVGCVEGPEDLSVNQAYMAGFGQS